MHFRKLSSSLLAATTLLSASLPAFANPFEMQTSPLFRNSTLQNNPALQNAVVSPSAGNAIARPNTPNRPANAGSGAIGNEEIQGLGDHQSWVDPNVLANDPRALCSDVGLGNNTTSSSSNIALNTYNRESSSSAQSHNDGGGGGVSILGIGVSGSGASQGSRNQTQSSEDRYSRTEARSNSSSTVQVGRNCDAFVESAAARDMNYEDNLTERYRIRVDRRGDQLNTLLENR